MLDVRHGGPCPIHEYTVNNQFGTYGLGHLRSSCATESFTNIYSVRIQGMVERRTPRMDTDLRPYHYRKLDRSKRQCPGMCWSQVRMSDGYDHWLMPLGRCETG